MTQPNPTDILTTIDALLLTVALNPGTVPTAQRERDRGMLEVLRELAQRVEENEKWQKDAEKAFVEMFAQWKWELEESFGRVGEHFSSMAETISALRAEYAEIKERLAALEAWRQMNEGDGK